MLQQNLEHSLEEGGCLWGPVCLFSWANYFPGQVNKSDSCFAKTLGHHGRPPCTCACSHLSLLSGQSEAPAARRPRDILSGGIAHLLPQILDTPSRQRSSVPSKSHRQCLRMCRDQHQPRSCAQPSFHPGLSVLPSGPCPLLLGLTSDQVPDSSFGSKSWLELPQRP